MRLIDADELLKQADTMALTPDGGVDANELADKIKAMPTMLTESQYELAVYILKRIAKKLEESILTGN